VEREVLSSSPWVSSNRTCGNGSKLLQGRFRLGMGKHFFTERVVKHCSRLARELVDAQSLLQCLRGTWTVPLITCYNFWP